MLLTIGELKYRVLNDIDAVVDELQEITGRGGTDEEQAWRSSLPKVARAFSAPSFSPLHLYFGTRGHLGLEYQLPASSSWCDMVLLGSHDDRPSAVVVELKDWSTRTDIPGPEEGLMERFGEPVLHPSDQVRGYTEYCRRFHSAVHDFNAMIYGCVVFTKEFYIERYREQPNSELVTAYPCFTLSPHDIEHTLPKYFSGRLTEPGETFAKAFDRGVYIQDRGFVRQIGKQILNPDASGFELLDNQRRAFTLTKLKIDCSVFASEGNPKKQVIIIDGPPGSGKSVLAAKLWAHLVTDDRLPEGSIVFTTTSACQNSNWAYLFGKTAHDAAASGVVKKATSYSPITTQTLGRLRKKHGKEFLNNAEQWRDNIDILRNLGEEFQDGGRDEQYLISIVDEAHALINPEEPEGRGQYGFAPTLGPQAYHIIRSSTVTILLLDAEQSFRDRENTTVVDIKQWAAELGAAVSAKISLSGVQFRCAGSKEYVDWVEAVLRGDPLDDIQKLSRAWKGKMDLEVCDSPAELETSLRERLEENKTARLLASYAREWKTKNTAVPHDLPDDMKDFYERYMFNGNVQYWSRIWNYVPKNGSDYTHYIQARPGSRMHDDPLCEVGCPYAVRGFDFDYVGMLWLGDLVWRSGKWIVNTGQVFETGLDRKLRAAKKEEDSYGAAQLELMKAIAQGYRILLTRPMYGIDLWFEDEETRKYFESCIV